MNKDTIHKNKINDFPYPQISNGFKKLGNNIISEPLNNLKDLLPDG